MKFNYERPDTSRSIQLGEKAALLGLKVGSPIPVHLTASVSGDIDFGADLKKNFLDDAFSLRVHSLTASASASIPSLSTNDLQLLGQFLKLKVTGNNLTLNAQVKLSSVELSLGQLNREPLSNLIQFAVPVASIGGSFTVTGSLLNSSLDHSILFSDDNIFDDQPIVVDLPNFSSGLKNLLQTGPSAFREALSQFGTAIDNLRGTSLFDQGLKIAHGLDAGTFLKLKQAWDAAISSQFEGSTAVTDIGTLLQRLGASNIVLDADNQLKFHVDLSRSLAQSSTPLGFDADLGPLGALSTASFANVQADAILKFTIGIDLNGSLGSQFVLSPSTTVHALYGKDGSESPSPSRWPLADRPGVADVVRFELSDGTTFDVNFDDIATIGDALAKINSAAANVLGTRYRSLYPLGVEFASLDTERKSIRITDRTRGELGIFKIVAVDNSLIGMPGLGLGIYGSSQSVNSDGFLEVEGAPLHSDGLAQRIYLISKDGDRPTLGGSVVVSASEIDAKVNVLLAKAEIQNGHGTTRGDLKIVLDGSAAVDNKINLEELVKAIGQPSMLDVQAEFGGSLNLTLPIQANAPWLPDTQKVSGDVQISWADLNRAATLEVSHSSELDQLFDFSHIDGSKLADALANITSYLGKFDQLQFLNQKLPIINRSANEILGILPRFQAMVDSFELDPSWPSKTFRSN